MKRTIATVLLGFIANTTSFALEIHHGKILKERQWMEGHLHVIFEDQKSNLTPSLTVHHFTEPLLKDGILLRDSVLDAQGNINTSVDALGFSEIYIENLDTQTRTYTLHQRFCAAMSCAHREIVISLEPNGYLNTNQRMVASYESGTPGDYPSSLYTTVINEAAQSGIATYANGTLHFDNVNTKQTHN